MFVSHFLGGIVSHCKKVKACKSPSKGWVGRVLSLQVLWWTSPETEKKLELRLPLPLR